MFEGDRRFRIIVRLPDDIRDDIGALVNLPVSLPSTTQGTGPTTIPLRQLAQFDLAEGPDQTVVIGGRVTATLLTLLVLPALHALFGGEAAERSEHRADGAFTEGRADPA